MLLLACYTQGELHTATLYTLEWTTWSSTLWDGCTTLPHAHQDSSVLRNILKGPLDWCRAAPQQAGLQAWLPVSCCPAKPAQDRVMVHSCSGAL